jgi:hypothetical protein
LIQVQRHEGPEALDRFHPTLESRRPYALLIPMTPAVEKLAKENTPRVVERAKLLPALHVDLESLCIALPPEHF